MRGAVLFVLLASSCQILSAAGEVHEYELDNGLKLIVKEDHRAPVVVSQVWYGVGASYEHDGITGVSHVLEHMMFKGTDRHGPGEFSRIIAENGGEDPPEPELTRSTPDEKNARLAHLADFHKRHEPEAKAAIASLQGTARDGGNVFEELLRTVRSCSLGQISNALYEVGGQYRRSM